MSIPDRLIWSYYELLTDVPAAETAERRRRVESGEENPRDAKADLARVVAAQFHGVEAAVRAEEDFRRAFSKGELPEEIETTELPAAETSAARVLVAAGLAASMREARRKIAEGALALYESGQARAVRDAEERLDASRPAILRLGRRFRRILWKV
jgi:tyrosyl-tRNA synthetase